MKNEVILEGSSRDDKSDNENRSKVARYSKY